MANIRKVERKGTGARGYAWEVRYRDPQRRDRSKTFRTKGEAEAFADSVETDIARGFYLDPRLGKKTFGVWSDEWLEARRAEIKPTTYMSYRGLLDNTCCRRSGAAPWPGFVRSTSSDSSGPCQTAAYRARVCAKRAGCSR